MEVHPEERFALQRDYFVFGGIKASYKLFMTLCVSVKKEQLIMLPAYKKVLAFVAKFLLRSSPSNTKSLNRGQKLGEYRI